MRPEDEVEITALPLFAAMNGVERDRVFAASFLQFFPAQLRLFELGARANFLHILIDGMVELYTSDRDRDSTMAIVRLIHSFILAAVYTDQRYLMSARTIMPSRILLVPAPLIREVIYEDRALMRFAMGELATGFRSFVRTLTDIITRQSAERFGNFLLLESIRLGGVDHFELQIERRTLASLLGMTSEHLSRAVGTLAAHGVTIKGATVHITDRLALAAYARPDPFIDLLED